MLEKRELDLLTWGDKERERSMKPAGFLFGRLGVAVSLLEMRTRTLRGAGDNHHSRANLIGVSKSGPHQGSKK